MGKVVNGDALELPYLRVANVQDGHLDLDVIKTVAVSHDDVARFSLQPGDVLFTEGGDFDKLGRGTVWRGEVPNCLHQNHVFAVRPSPAKLLPEFLAALASSAHGRRFFQLSSKQSTNLASINSTQLKEFPVPLPSLDLQRKIAEILRTWDEALEKLTALRAAKARRLGSLRARLLFGKLRLHRRRHNWAATRLDAVTHELTRRNGAKGLGRDCVMGVTKAEGVVPMREQTIAGDISRYKRLPPRAFAYNPMRINVGSIAMNEREEEVLVSPDYVVFACNADGLDPDYLDHLRKTSWWAHYINSGGSGSVRQRTYYDDLAALKLPLPELDEQRAIAAVLNTARADMAATEREIEAVTQQKRGLMQKLLTGEWRVNSEKVLA
jgi:type I restriction enzyme S subunit